MTGRDRQAADKDAASRAARPEQRPASGQRRVENSMLLQLQRRVGNRATNGLLDGGQALPQDVRRALEAWVGADLGAVRVHAGEDARRLVRSLDAVAVTVGRDILLGVNSGAPGSAERLGLLADEAMHTQQQGPYPLPPGTPTLQVDPSAHLEAEARAAGAGATISAELFGDARGHPRPASPAPVESRPGPAIMRADELPQLTGRQLKQWERIKQKLNRAQLTLNEVGLEEDQVIPLLKERGAQAFLDEIEIRVDKALGDRGAVAAEFAERHRLEDPFPHLAEVGSEAAGGSIVKSRSWPGNRGESRATATGRFVHTWAEDIILGRLARAGPGSAEAAELRAELNLTWPAGVTPNEGPNRVVLRLPNGKTYIPDGIDFERRIVYELKPEGSETEASREANLYARAAEQVLGGGRWGWAPATYSMAGAQRYLTDIGYLKPRPSQARAGEAEANEPTRLEAAETASRIAEAKTTEPAAAVSTKIESASEPSTSAESASTSSTRAESAADASAAAESAAPESTRAESAADAELEAELASARTTGRLSERGIELLWELQPGAAQILLGSSRLPVAEQRRVLAQLPGGPLPVRTRIGAAGLLAFQLATEFLPEVNAELERQRSGDVGAAMADVLWWLDKDVVPHVVGVIDHLQPKENERTTDLDRVLKLSRTPDLDYLAITSVDEESIELEFHIWASAHLINYRDWFFFIERSKAIKGVGDNPATQQWSVRTGDVVDKWYGFDVTETWRPSPALTRILNEAWVTMVRGRPEEAGHPRQVGTEEAVARLGTGPGPEQRSEELRSLRYHPQDVFGGLPQAIGKKRFAGPRRRLYPIGSHFELSDFRQESVLYTFPPSVVDVEVPAGLVVVGGADFATYAQIYQNNDLSLSGGRELMLAWEDELEDVR